MKTLIIGAGNMGTAIAFYLANTFTETVYLLDSDENALEQFNAKMQKPNLNKVNLIKHNVFDKSFFTNLISEYDIIISTLPWLEHIKLCKILENYTLIVIGIARPDYDYYYKTLKKRYDIKATIIHGCGLEPGLSELFTQHLVKRFTRPHEVFIACGGIPTKPLPPLGYKLVFGGDDLPFKYRKTFKIDHGLICSVPRFGDVEELCIDAIGVLECWNDGLTPWLAEYLLTKGVISCKQKTIRWPGYARMVDFLHQAGFLSEEVIPITKKLLIPQLKLATDEMDMVIQHICVKGLIQNEIYESYLEIIDYKDLETKLTAMARTTGFSAALIARYISENKLKLSREATLVDCYSEELFNYLCFHLKNAGIQINLNFINEGKNANKI